jgi:hypothetical protein
MDYYYYYCYLLMLLLHVCFASLPYRGWDCHWREVVVSCLCVEGLVVWRCYPSKAELMMMLRAICSLKRVMVSGVIWVVLFRRILLAKKHV